MKINNFTNQRCNWCISVYLSNGNIFNSCEDILWNISVTLSFISFQTLTLENPITKDNTNLIFITFNKFVHSKFRYSNLIYPMTINNEVEEAEVKENIYIYLSVMATNFLFCQTTKLSDQMNGQHQPPNGTSPSCSGCYRGYRSGTIH